MINEGNDSFKVKSDIFTAISTDEPISKFSRTTHAVSPPSAVDNGGLPIGTNKFYANMLLGDQTNAVWTHPYSVWRSTTSGLEGLACNQTTTADRVFGSGSPPQYFYSPVGITSIIFGSPDFNSSTTLGMKNVKHLSTEVIVTSSSGGHISAPLVQGAAFVTAIYNNLVPQISSGVGISSFTAETSPKDGISKYSIKLNNSRVWTLYVTIPNDQSLTLSLNNGIIVGSGSVSGCVFQVCSSTDSTFDSIAGAYPTGGTLSGSVSDTTGTYAIEYTVAGSSKNGTTGIFALPHHVSTFTNDMSSLSTSVKMDTTTKGTATLYLTNSFKFSLSIPSNVGLEPFSTIENAKVNWSSDCKSAMLSAATTEAAYDVVSESNIETMYGSGKILAKYAWVLYVCHYVLSDDTLTETLLEKLKKAIEIFAGNSQKIPLSYDKTWGGVCSTADSSGDYGNSYYNDHHFHYGYHVLAAAVTAMVDKARGGTWVDNIKDWVNNLVRDVATPLDEDKYFPAFRSFDWYNGHSWAKGIFASGDGKDEESTSEDYNCYFGFKLWGSIIGDTALEQRSALQLGVLNHSLNSYFLFADDNTVQPSNFIANKVSGILFENKIDHTTYFGTALQYIQMIHAIPITSISSFIRHPTFVEEEWKQKLDAIVGDVTDGWLGIMYLNRALYDPSSAYKFFSGSSFSRSYLDDGQSLTWSLCYSGAFGSS